MPRRKLSSFFLFRHRIGIAYLFVFAALAALLTLALLIPGGITPAEQTSSVQAMSSGIIGVNEPYFLLQKASISLFGLSVFSIKLPSILLGAILGISLFLLLKRWLTLAIAVFCALIIFSGSTFLTLAGTGSPQILYVLFPALLLFFGTRVIARERGLIVFATLLLITIGMALLTPTMIYLLMLAIVLAALNPHVRYGFRRLPLTGLLLLVIGFLIAVAPLAYLVTSDPTALRQILALPASLSFGIIGADIGLIGQLFGSFLAPTLVAGMIVPLLGLAEAGLALLGLYRIARAIYTARAQFIVGWLVIGLVFAMLSGLGILLYLPVALLASFGLSQLAAIWYRTFPLNPYARVSALLPIGLLIAAVVIGSTVRYVDGMLYAPGVADTYSHDLPLLQSYLAESKLTNATLAVARGDVAFYQNLGSPAIRQVISITDASTGAETVIAAGQLPNAGAPSRILTDGRAHDADRFYIYR